MVHLQGLDIGPESLKNFQAELQDCKSVIWNGPMGVFEMEAFAKGTFGIAHTLAALSNKVRQDTSYKVGFTGSCLVAAAVPQWLLCNACSGSSVYT